MRLQFCHSWTIAQKIKKLSLRFLIHRVKMQLNVDVSPPAKIMTLRRGLTYVNYCPGVFV